MSEAAHRANTWIGILFAIGALCFVVGPFPGYVQRVGSSADGVTFFVGSIFFTAAALLQLVTTRVTGGGRADWWAAAIQFAGTLFFNLSTFEALQKSLDTNATDRLVWQPDVYGSTCFLVSSLIAYGVANGGFRHRRHTNAARIAAINLVGSVAFGVSAAASYVIPATGDVLDLGASNFSTAIGAICFLVGAVLLLPPLSSRRPS